MTIKKKLVFMMVMLCTTQAQADSWLDDWVDAKTVTSPGYYQGQTRGYFTGGSYQARWHMNNESIIDFQPPRIESGCGGINLFGGSVSFLDADRLADKLQSILQAAPAVAIDMAMKTLCKECSETIRSLEQLSNNLNGMMQSDCQSAKDLAAKFMPDIPINNPLNTTVANLKQKFNIVRDYHENTEEVAANDGNPGVDMRVATEDCNADFRDIFQPGSLVARIAEDLNFDDYADLLRGLLGDVNITFVNNVYDMDTVPSCRANNPYTLEDFLSGSVQERPQGGECRDNSVTDFHGYVSTFLDEIADKLESGELALTDDETAFINAAPLPVLQTLRLGVMTQNLSGAKATLRDTLSVAMAYYAIDDLYRNVHYLLNHAKTAAKKATVADGDSELCNPIVFAPAIKQVESWGKDIRGLRASARQSYRAEIESLANYQTLIKSIVEQYQTASRDTMTNLAD
jgi:conjugative transfer pilus assembly protein TraH